jgi:glutamate-1-semialdehyde 2,1-aminomutase
MDPKGWRDETVKRFDHSIRAFQKAQAHLAGGVSSIMRAAAKPVPLFFRSGSGAVLIDLDGHRYIDYALGWGPLILGHSHPAVLRAVRSQLQKFQHLGAQHKLEAQVAQKICQMVPSAEVVAFSNTGSEAVQLALRLARASTGKQKFIKFEGHYHGWIDNVLLSYHSPRDIESKGKAVPGSEGQSLSGFEDVCILPWNDFDALERAVGEQSDHIAAIVTEPILCNSSCLMPCGDYLQKMRQLADRFGIVLIFDEVITGFRVAPGGAQELFGIKPDVTVLGKALGSGFPLSAVAGNKAIMDLIAQRRVVHAGTFNGNPISLAAAAATLEILSAHAGRLLKKIRERGEQLKSGISKVAREQGIPCLINGVGSAFHLSFTSRSSMHNYRDTLDADNALRDRFIESMLGFGIYLIPDGRWYVSAALTPAHVKTTLDAVGKSFKKLKAIE